MDNILKYLIQLKADGGNIHAVARETLGELDKIDKSAKNVGQSLRDAFSFSNFKSSLMSIPGMQFLMNPYTIIGAGIGAITKLGAEAESTALQFRLLVGDEQKAADVLAEIKEYANHTPYEAMDLIESAKMMIQFGQSADQAYDTLKRLGDIAGADKNRMQSLSLAVSQALSKGKLDGGDLNQMINAGFNPLRILEEKTGKSQAELRKMMGEGKLTATELTYAIQQATEAGGKFAGNAEAAAETIEGKFSTFIGKLKDMAAKAFEAIKPLINTLIDIGTWIADNIDLITALGTAIGAIAIGANAASIALAIYKGAVTAATVVQTAFNAILTMNPIGIVIAAVGALAAAVIYCWNKFAGFRAFLMTMWDVIKQFGGIIKDFIINRMIDMLDGLGDVAKALKALFSGDFKGAWESAKSSVGKLTGANAIGEAVAKSRNAINGVASNFNAHLTREKAKDAAKAKKKNEISKPGLVGSEDLYKSEGNTKEGKGAKSKDASAIATGGQRNTSITMNIGKFFDTLQVTMMDKTDTADLETIVVQSLNRALAIATSTDR
jgi:tape measure domain-containing protein